MAQIARGSFQRVVTIIMTWSFVTIGAVVASVGAYGVATAVDYWSIWPKAQAVVVRNEARTVRTRNGTVTVTEPVFRFTVGATTVEAKSGTGRSPPEFAPGAGITVAYDPRDPSHVTQQVDVRTDSFVAIGVGVGLMLSGAALGLLFKWLAKPTSSGT